MRFFARPTLDETAENQWDMFADLTNFWARIPHTATWGEIYHLMHRLHHYRSLKSVFLICLDEPILSLHNLTTAPLSFWDDCRGLSELGLSVTLRSTVEAPASLVPFRGSPLFLERLRLDIFDNSDFEPGSKHLPIMSHIARFLVDMAGHTCRFSFRAASAGVEAEKLHCTTIGALENEIRAIIEQDRPTTGWHKLSKAEHLQPPSDKVLGDEVVGFSTR